MRLGFIKLTVVMPLNLCNRMKPIYILCKIEFSQNFTKCVTDRTYLQCVAFLSFTLALRVFFWGGFFIST